MNTMPSPACAMASWAMSASTTSRNYIKRASCGKPSPRRKLPVLLIDEIDKADIEFPNDLLQELDRMSFDVYETQERIEARNARSSSSPRTTKRNCPTHSCAAASSTTSSSPIARRCRRSSTSTSRHPEDPRLQGDGDLLRSPRSPRPQEEAFDQRTARLAEAAAQRGHAARRPAEPRPTKAIPPLHGALLKNEQDVMLFERLAFMARRQGAEHLPRHPKGPPPAP
jgi:hypothetical protein